MPDARIPTTYRYDAESKAIHRRRGEGEKLLEDKIVASYDPDTGVITIPNANFMRLYKPEITTFLAENELKMREFVRADLPPDKPLTKSTPPRPKKTPHEGDKTKAVVEWYKTHFPNKFATRYGLLGTYTGKVRIKVPTWEPRPVDKLPEYRGEFVDEKEVQDAIVTIRKTHLSYTPDECLDWEGEEPQYDEDTDN